MPTTFWKAVDVVVPQEEQAVGEGRVLHDHRQDRHEHIGFDREHVVQEARFLHAFLPAPQASAEGFHDAEGFDRIKIIEGFDPN